MKEQRTNPKESLLTYLYVETAGAILIINTDLADVVKPLELKGLVKFIVSQQSVPKLQYEEDGIFAPMVFNSYPTECYFPWDSILSIQSIDGGIVLAYNQDTSQPPVIEKSKPKEEKEMEKLGDNVISVDFKRRVKLI